MNAGNGASGSFANGARTRKITLDATIIAKANRLSPRPAGRFESNTVPSPVGASAVRPFSSICDRRVAANGSAMQWQRRRAHSVADREKFSDPMSSGSAYGFNRFCERLDQFSARHYTTAQCAEANAQRGLE